MPRKSTGLTLDEHKCLGARLKHIRSMLWHIHQEFSESYGKTKPPTKAMAKICRDLEKLRCAMDDQLFKDHPYIWRTDPNGESALRYYYGPQLGTGENTGQPARFHLLPDDPKLQMRLGAQLDAKPPAEDGQEG